MTTTATDPGLVVLSALAEIVLADRQAKARALADIAAEVAPAWGCQPDDIYLDTEHIGGHGYVPVLRGNGNCVQLRQTAAGYQVIGQ